MITRPEQAITERDLAEFEGYLDWYYARRRLARTLASLPWIEAEGRRTLLTHAVSRYPSLRQRPTVPFGWSVERIYDCDAWEIGPSWFVVPRRWYWNARHRFYDWAFRVRLIDGREGCCYSEARWFPDMPRFE